MRSISTDSSVIKRVRAMLDQMYGDRIERVVLYGSRARGDGNRDSDYDVAVFLNDLPDRWRELDRLADLRTEILSETGAFVDARPFRAETYAERSPLMHEIRNDGVEV